MRRDYMLSRDIDWFARCDSYFLHFASNGSILPINFKHSDLRRIQQAVAETERAIEKYASKESARNVLRVLGDLFNGDGNIQETTELGSDWIKEIGAAYQYYCKEKEIL